jgi:hypothetical protein
VNTVMKMWEISWLVQEQLASTLFHGIRSLGVINIKLLITCHCELRDSPTYERLRFLDCALKSVCSQART